MVLRGLDSKAEVIAYGPTMHIDLETEGRDLTPQEVIALASGMTFKDKDARELAINALKATTADAAKDGGQTFEQYIEKSLMGSALRGHASLTTSAGLWVLYNGTSKHVDSMFTGAQFASGLMPSGRRIPVDLEAIRAPDSVIESCQAVQDLYERVSTANVQFYLDLLAKGLPKEAVAKITQYGLAGGGFMFLPLETLFQYRQEFDANGKFVPQEGHQLVSQLENELEDLGMDILYCARAAAARNTPSFPFIYSDPNKSRLVDVMARIDAGRFKHLNPLVFDRGMGPRQEFHAALDELVALEKEIKASPESVQARWRDVLAARRDISSRFPFSMDYASLTKNSWRVWGEIKRHRTVPQQVQSVHDAAEKAWGKFNQYAGEFSARELTDMTIDELAQYVCVPPEVRKDKELTFRWLELTRDSLDAYKTLIASGIPAGDASSVLPRGILVNVLKTLNTAQVLDLYLPLRMCGTCEPEMKATTRAEATEVKRLLGEKYTGLIHPKCFSGFCFEPFSAYSKCGQANSGLGFKYDEPFHKAMRAEQEQLFRNMLDL